MIKQCAGVKKGQIDPVMRRWDNFTSSSYEIAKLKKRDNIYLILAYKLVQNDYGQCGFDGK